MLWPTGVQRGLFEKRVSGSSLQCNGSISIDWSKAKIQHIPPLIRLSQGLCDSSIRPETMIISTSSSIMRTSFLQSLALEHTIISLGAFDILVAGVVCVANTDNTGFIGASGTVPARAQVTAKPGLETVGCGFDGQSVAYCAVVERVKRSDTAFVGVALQWYSLIVVSDNSEDFEGALFFNSCSGGLSS
jgi:hypothetical protein